MNTIEALRTELAEVERNYNDLLNSVMLHAPRCWDGDESMHYLADLYVRHLEHMADQRYRTPELSRHRSTCDGQC